MTRLSTIRPATVAGIFSGSRVSFVFSPWALWRSEAKSFRRKSLGNAMPLPRRALSFSRRSSTSLFSSSIVLDALFEACGDEFVEVAVEHRLCRALLDAGTQVLDPRLIEHVGADLVSPLDVGLGRFELRLLGVALAQLELVEPRFQHRHALGAVAVLRAVVLALHHDVGGQVRDAHRGFRLVDVLAAGARGAVD